MMTCEREQTLKTRCNPTAEKEQYKCANWSQFFFFGKRIIFREERFGSHIMVAD